MLSTTFAVNVPSAVSLTSRRKNVSSFSCSSKNAVTAQRPASDFSDAAAPSAPEFAEITAASNERVADLMSLHPAFGRAGLSRGAALEVCRTAVTAVNALQDRAIADETLDFETAVVECQRLARGYLATYLP